MTTATTHIKRRRKLRACCAGALAPTAYPFHYPGDRMDICEVCNPALKPKRFQSLRRVRDGFAIAVLLPIVILIEKVMR